MKKITTIGLCLVGLIVVVISSIYYLEHKKDIYLQSRCKNIKIVDATVDCFNYIHVTGAWDNGEYNIDDTQHSDLTIAVVKDISSINYVGGNIYVKNEASHYGYFTDTHEYTFSYFDGKEIKILRSKDEKSFPQYFVIDTVTGSTTPYLNFKDIPNSEQLNFKVK